MAARTKQNTDAKNANTNQAVLCMTQQELQFYAASPNILLLRHKKNLSEEEAVQLSLSLINTKRSREHEWLQYKNKIIESTAVA